MSKDLGSKKVDIQKEGEVMVSKKAEESPVPITDFEIETIILDDLRFKKNLERVQKEFIKYWRKFLATEEGKALKKANSSAFAEFDNDDEVARYVALDIANREGVKIYRHNMEHPENLWKHGFRIPYDSAIPIMKAYVKRKEGQIAIREGAHQKLVGFEDGDVDSVV